MKKLAPFPLLFLMILLLCFPAQAIRAGREGLALFFDSVLPALFPFYVLVSLLGRTSLVSWVKDRPALALPACFLLGGLSGYPVGARLSCLLGRGELACRCNLCSPMFLLGVVAISLAGNPAMFWPVAAGHYGGGALLLLLELLARGKAPPAGRPRPRPRPAAAGGAIQAIGEGMVGMLRIGGCLLFFYVCAGLTGCLLPRIPPALTALLSGLLEMTCGCYAVSKLGLSGRVCAGLYAFLVSFGGLSVFAQTMIETDSLRPGRYLMEKLAHGLLAGGLAYLLSPLLLQESTAAFSSAAQAYLANTKLCFAFFFAGCLGLVSAYLFATLANGLSKPQK